MKPWMLQVIAILVLVGVGVVLVVGSGVVGVKASSGHTRPVSWFLHTAMRRSVQAHSRGIEVPPLEDPALVRRGAGHYELGCRLCHGAPGDQHLPRVAGSMTPHPPRLDEVVSAWDDRELFYVVRYGIKFTAMPAWPSVEREDEVWAMVAFLRAWPTFDAARYAAYVSPSTEAGPAVVRERCASCHGADGAGPAPGVFPHIGGQPEVYLQEALLAYARGDRASGTMGIVAADLSPADRQEAARWYASRPRPEGRHPVDRALAARGEALALDGTERTPACAACHGPWPTPRNPAYPELAGLHPEWISLQLGLFRQGHRGGSPWAELMSTVADHGLDEERIPEVSAYYGQLPGRISADPLPTRTEHLHREDPIR